MLLIDTISSCVDFFFPNLRIKIFPSYNLQHTPVRFIWFTFGIPSLPLPAITSPLHYSQPSGLYFEDLHCIVRWQPLPLIQQWDINLWFPKPMKPDSKHTCGIFKQAPPSFLLWDAGKISHINISKVTDLRWFHNLVPPQAKSWVPQCLRLVNIRKDPLLN